MLQRLFAETLNATIKAPPVNLSCINGLCNLILAHSFWYEIYYGPDFLTWAVILYLVCSVKPLFCRTGISENF